VETAGLPIISSLASRWPLDFNDKACAAQFFGLQHVRGPAFKGWHEQDIQATIHGLRNDPVGRTAPTPGESPEDVADRLVERLSSDSVRIHKMIGAARTVPVALGSMHWTLVRFAKPRLVTSDQPVIVWPLSLKLQHAVANLEHLRVHVPPALVDLDQIARVNVGQLHPTRLPANPDGIGQGILFP
jgi:hypothetical protein